MSVNTVPPHEFTHDNYGPFIGYGGFDEFDHHKNKPRHGFAELGRCDATKLRCRPREGEAVMLWSEENREQFWIHVIKFS